MLNNSKAVKRLSVIVLRSFNLIKAIFLNDRTERLAYSNAQLVYKCQSDSYFSWWHGGSLTAGSLCHGAFGTMVNPALRVAA